MLKNTFQAMQQRTYPYLLMENVHSLHGDETRSELALSSL